LLIRVQIRGWLPSSCTPNVSPQQHLIASDVTEKPTNAPTNVPPTRQRVELPAGSIGFTLKSDAETIRDIEKIQETAIKAAQEVKKFALR